jgi:hypothetical protein
MRVGTIAWCSLVLSAGLLAGCETARYRGASPSARTFSESPDMKDYYVGMNFNFSLERPEQYHRTAVPEMASAMAAPEPPVQVQTSIAPDADED